MGAREEKLVFENHNGFPIIHSVARLSWRLVVPSIKATSICEEATNQRFPSRKLVPFARKIENSLLDSWK